MSLFSRLFKNSKKELRSFEELLEKDHNISKDEAIKILIKEVEILRSKLKKITGQ